MFHRYSIQLKEAKYITINVSQPGIDMSTLRHSRRSREVAGCVVRNKFQLVLVRKPETAFPNGKWRS